MSNKQKWLNVLYIYLGLFLFVIVIDSLGLADRPRPVGGGGICAVMGDEVLYNSDCVYEMIN